MNHGGKPDEYLMAQVAQGERECLGLLVRRYASPLLTFLVRMMGDQHRAEELFQEVFLAVWKHRKQYTFPKPFKSWLFTIAANRCRADFRSAKPQPLPISALETSVKASNGPAPDDALLGQETAQQVAAAVALLPPQQRTVVVLRIWNGLSYAEIAVATGRAEGTVRSHMHHALAALRTSLAALA
ncbi:RNA polymerase sigma factor [Lignipirellula cremea]|uniref:ECF RNA polymerase sigma factor SigW n=1 Tax=Lignipirellula cremea TaxID=2528010 RepID=A0A518E047_9BACT|nr:RNA polymerase sigma factor [Lignipirellula cremea]QDU97462.1 ECF RNA polymerase sigma factor SigW [Lignipirellula cremea]